MLVDLVAVYSDLTHGERATCVSPHVGVYRGWSIKVPLKYREADGLEIKDGIESLPQTSTVPVSFFYTSSKEGYGKLDI